ncbi:MAG TPA: murein peptide amidase A [Firmicutes bacterium]|nr:murein peptide amidase A [Bacillota bacterium]
MGIRPEYLTEADEIPDFWISTGEEIDGLLSRIVKKGEVGVIGTSAGGRPIKAVFYGTPRQGSGTTTFSGSLGYRNVRAYLGPDYEKKVALIFAGVHGSELEGIVGLANLIAVLETGADLAGRSRPRLTEAAGRIDRLIIIPIVNVDGRARLPIRKEAYRGTDNSVHRYINCGCWQNGQPIGWPGCKEFIPLDFTKTEFPGCYPNDAGVNIQHDDFLGHPQPETRALLDLVAKERPDLTINMHTGAPPKNFYMRMHRPFMEPALTAAFDGLYRQVHNGLTLAGLQSTGDVELEATPPAPTNTSPYNLDTVLNLHCGALTALIEAPCHGFSGTNRAGQVVKHTPKDLLDAQLVTYQECLLYLAETGGRHRWAGGAQTKK